MTLGAVVLLVLAWRAGTLGQIRGHVRWLALYAVAEVTIPFPMLAFGEQRVSSSGSTSPAARASSGGRRRS